MNYEDEDNEKRIKIPFKKVGDRFEFLYGGDIPIKDGSIGQVIVPIDSVTKQEFKDNLLIESSMQVLPAGALILIGMTEHNMAYKADPNYRVDYYYLTPGITYFEPVVLEKPAKKSGSSNSKYISSEKIEGGLWLNLKGLDDCNIKSGPVKMLNHPELNNAISLNHAYTLLSEKIEKHRLSHTGNIYKRCYYQEANGKWYPLKLLRDNMKIDVEKSIIDRTWAEFKNKIGWKMKS